MKVKNCFKQFMWLIAVFCFVAIHYAGSVTAMAADSDYPEITPANLTCYYGYEQLGKMENGETLQKCYSYLEELAWDFYISDKEVTVEDFGDGFYMYVAAVADLSERFTLRECAIINDNWDYIAASFENDNPIYYYMRNALGMMMTYYSYDDIIKIYVSTYEDGETGEMIESFVEVETRKQYREMIEAKLHEYYDLTKDMTSDYEKEEAIYKKVMAEVYYYEEDLWALSSHTIIGAFSGEKTVCDGYAQAFQLACNYCGVDCIWVSGDTPVGAHAWNAVKLGDEWYSLDATWDDCDPIGDSPYYYSNRMGIADEDGRDYFNMPFQYFYCSHKPHAEEIAYMVWPEFSDDDTYWGVSEKAIVNEKAAVNLEGEITYEQMVAACEYICEQIEAGERRIDIYAWDSFIIDEETEQGTFIKMIEEAVENYVSETGQKFELSHGYNFGSASLFMNFESETSVNSLFALTVLVSERIDYSDDIVYYKDNVDGSGTGIFVDEYRTEGDSVSIPAAIDGEEVRAIDVLTDAKIVIVPEGVRIVGVGGDNLYQVILPDTVRDIVFIGLGNTDAVFVPESVKFIMGGAVWNKIFGYAGTKAEAFAEEYNMLFYDVTGKELIEAIEISEFVLPQIGDNIAEVLSSNVIEAEEFTVTKLICDSEDTVAKGAKEYTIEIYVSTNGNYAITPNTFAKINDEAAWVECIDLNTAVIRYTYTNTVEVNEINFPDEVFRAYVSANFDTEGGAPDGIISMAEAQAVEDISVSDRGIKNLKGIEFFPNLRRLECYNNAELTMLDVSGNSKLAILYCTNTGITNLDVRNNTALRLLECANTGITSLDVSNNAELDSLVCSNTKITSLDVSKNSRLKSLYLSGTKITDLDVSNNVKLECLVCYDNTALTSLKLNGAEALVDFDCSNTKLTSLDVSNLSKLENIRCSNTDIESLDLSGHTALRYLNCAGVKIENLDVVNCTGLYDAEFSFGEVGCCYDFGNLIGFDTDKILNFSGGELKDGKVIGFTGSSNKIHCSYTNSEGGNVTIRMTGTFTGEHSYADGVCSDCGAEYVAGVAINESNFPDRSFRVYVSSKFDKNSDKTLSQEEIEAVTSIDLSGQPGSINGFKSFKGIEYFTALRSFDCSYTRITSLDLSSNTLLNSFNAEGMEYDIGKVKGSYDLSNIAYLDTSKASDWTGATYRNGILTNFTDTKVTYLYDCGNGFTATFTLVAELEEQDTDTTIYDGVDYAAVYNYEYYIAKYPEITGNALEYFVTTGMALGHQASEEFSLLAYRSNYPDLGVAFGSDNIKYYMHYINNGKAEGRNATVVLVESDTKYYGVEYAEVYNYDYYISNNPDLKAAFGDNKAAALIHFANMGMKEGRQACENFGPKIYKFNYPELQNSFGEDMVLYYHHYMDYGKDEGRNGATRDFSAYCKYEGVDYTPVYNYEDYIERNPDVFDAYGLDANAVLKHFVTVGMAEGRQGSDDFNYNIYRSNYPDLEVAFGENRAEYYHHYINSGYNEGRNAATSNYTSDTVYAGVDYADVYSYDYYVTANPDVAAAIGDNKIAILAHFVRNGMAEGRQGSAEFNVQIYMEKNPDLAESLGTDLKAYYMHYINEGKAAGREAN